MGYLIAGLVIFLGVHSVRIFADGWRTAQIAKWGENTWKAGYTIKSAVGLGLIIWGYSLARLEPGLLWVPPVAMRHIAATLMLIAMILLVAAYVPKNSIRGRLHHPMLLSVKTWAFAHLLANGNLADVVLFGSFLVWAVLCFINAKKRDRAEGKVYPQGQTLPTIVTVVIGLVVYGAFVMGLHRWLIGVPVF